ncbi:MAG: bifunctional phosphopantothenoylcysteine decarboxylase/phosphopantothenate--cysteine ligase CoaBC [Myxococcales bacterium]|nr:MAG: bifunctional phosphopantothenoylcysteine decarboxylase/phosphopantothenate--cysteine ligase CoaBC [Myxococcales bacterium]
MQVRSKHIVLGVGGGIAAFKSVYLLRELGRAGFDVRVAMTPSAKHFVTPLSFAALSRHPVESDLWISPQGEEKHVELASWADAMVVAPATANLLARISHGMADDILAATLLCFKGPVFIAPAMHPSMWSHPATKHNIAILKERGVQLIGPEHGALANGEQGLGRMSEPQHIVEKLQAKLFAKQDYANKRVLVTAGPTYEDIDPVRYLTNRSSGKMGFALAEQALARGAEVTLVAGPVKLDCSNSIRRIDVRSAEEMNRVVLEHSPKNDVVIMAAAVADYRPAKKVDQKIKKSSEPRSLELSPNPDILANISKKKTENMPILAGFCLETDNLVNSAREKLERKGADLIVANLANKALEGDHTELTLVDKQNAKALGAMSKTQAANAVLDALIAKVK